MLLRKLYRTMLAYKAQFISMILMTALGTGVFVGFNMEWVSIEKNTDAFFEETGYADYRIVSESGFTAEALARPGVRDAAVRVDGESFPLRLEVRDEGPGVPEAQLPRLFDVFYRGDAARTAPDSGSGLGLAVVKRAAEQLHGSVRAETGSPGGLCVTVSLPLAEETQYEQNSDH